MNRAQAAREARGLVAEWIWAVMATEVNWRECYEPADLERVIAELHLIQERFEQAGPSLFHRLNPPARERVAPAAEPAPMVAVPLTCGHDGSVAEDEQHTILFWCPECKALRDRRTEGARP